MGGKKIVFSRQKEAGNSGQRSSAFVSGFSSFICQPKTWCRYGFLVSYFPLIHHDGNHFSVKLNGKISIRVNIDAWEVRLMINYLKPLFFAVTTRGHV